jgi:hypothetical protein
MANFHAHAIRPFYHGDMKPSLAREGLHLKPITMLVCIITLLILMLGAAILGARVHESRSGGVVVFKSRLL